MKSKRKALYALIALVILCSIIAATVLISGAADVKITGDMIEIENSCLFSFIFEISECKGSESFFVEDLDSSS